VVDWFHFSQSGAFFVPDPPRGAPLDVRAVATGGRAMTRWGWLLMGVSVGGTTGLFVWCLWRVLRTPESREKVHGVLDTEREIEEQDRD
jgi:transcription initiation factor TFIID subunit TAF12